MATARVSARHKVFVLPHEPALVSTVPGTKVARVANVDICIVPHVTPAVRFARNLGHRVPAPILSQYDWNGDSPFQAQKTTAALLTMNERAYVLSEIGTGKTRAALHAANFLLLNGEIRSVAVVAPLSTLVRVWELEIFKYFSHLTTHVLHGDRARRIQLLNKPGDIYIINHDGVETILPELMASQIDCIVVDELSYYRNSRTDRWKALNALASGRKYVWGMTGSPTPNEPSDAYGQVKLLTPNRVPKFFGKFQELTMRKITQFKWVPKANALDVVYDAMQPAVRFKRSEVVELPPTSYQTREVKLGTRQTKVYEALLKKSHHMCAEGEITALNEGVLMSKLLQIASGWVYTTKRAVVSLDNDERVDSLREVLQEADGKAIVFVEYIHAARALHAALGTSFSTALVTGETTLSERNQIFHDFQETPDPKVLIAHPRCMSHGLTLTAASTAIWFIPSTSNETYEQANGRITRPGQKSKTLVVHLCGSAVERKLYGRLQSKAKVQGALLEMFEEQKSVF